MKKKIGSFVAYLVSKIFAVLKHEPLSSWSRDELREVNFSFSQFGEDLIISKYLSQFSPNDGIYVDVGAFNPITFSNTLLLYKQGWQGINIDVDRDKVEDFIKHRPRDLSIKAAISDTQEQVQFAKYPARATNRILPIDATDYCSAIGEEPIEVTTLETTRLDDVIAATPFADRKIYYLNIDCEGNDLKVLKSCNLDRYLPKIISIEAWSQQELAEIEAYLLPKGYVLQSSAHLTKIFTHC
jgi:FkbM family methyltransferase